MKCKYCNYRFQVAGYYSRHLRLHYSNEPVRSPNPPLAAQEAVSYLQELAIVVPVVKHRKRSIQATRETVSTWGVNMYPQYWYAKFLEGCFQLKNEPVGSHSPSPPPTAQDSVLTLQEPAIVVPVAKCRRRSSQATDEPVSTWDVALYPQYWYAQCTGAYFQLQGAYTEHWRTAAAPSSSSTGVWSR